MITSKQRAQLRGLAMQEDTIVFVGKGGITENLIESVSAALKARELVKGKVLENSMLTAREACDALCEACKADGVQVIGTLKALGADNRFVQRIFLTQAAMLIGKGMVWGNMIGLGLVAVQYFSHLIPLEASTYYVSYVPMAFAWGWIIALNILTAVVSLLILLLPSRIVAKISPAKVMHFE